MYLFTGAVSLFTVYLFTGALSLFMVCICLQVLYLCLKYLFVYRCCDNHDQSRRSHECTPETEAQIYQGHRHANRSLQTDRGQGECSTRGQHLHSELVIALQSNPCHTHNSIQMLF